jgi:hypothetical protein
MRRFLLALIAVVLAAAPSLAARATPVYPDTPLVLLPQ